jgi:hypothetical protein
VADAGQRGELVVGGDELAGALGRRLPTVSSASPQMNGQNARQTGYRQDATLSFCTVDVGFRSNP